MAARFVVAMLLLGTAALAALGWAPAPAAANGCTPCECGAAYCEGNRTYWPVARWTNASQGSTAVKGEPFLLSWEIRLETFDEPPASPNRSVEWGSTGLILARHPILTCPTGCFDLANVSYEGTGNATYPSTHSVQLTFNRTGPWWVLPFLSAGRGERYPHQWGPQLNVTVVPPPTPSGSSSGATETGRRTPGPSAALGLAVVGLAALLRRRLR